VEDMVSLEISQTWMVSCIYEGGFHHQLSDLHYKGYVSHFSHLQAILQKNFMNLFSVSLFREAHKHKNDKRLVNLALDVSFL